MADRYGPGRVLAFGVVVMALGFALTPFVANQWGLVFTIGLLSAAGSGRAVSVLIGAAARGSARSCAAWHQAPSMRVGRSANSSFALCCSAPISGFGWRG